MLGFVKSTQILQIQVLRVISKFVQVLAKARKAFCFHDDTQDKNRYSCECEFGEFSQIWSSFWKSGEFGENKMDSLLNANYVFCT